MKGFAEYVIYDAATGKVLSRVSIPPGTPPPTRPGRGALRVRDMPEQARRRPSQFRVRGGRLEPGGE